VNAGIVIVVLLVAVLVAVFQIARHDTSPEQRALGAAKALARRWTRRLGVELDALTPTSDMSRLIFGEARQRYTTANEQLPRARTARQFELVTNTAVEGLYYTRATRCVLELDPGPALPCLIGQSAAGNVSEAREITVDDHCYAAAPDPSRKTPHYFPGGTVAGRPVPQGWYSEPWWQPAMRAGAWGVGSMFLFCELFGRTSQTWRVGHQ
jgi:hypothetical protein